MQHLGLPMQVMGLQLPGLGSAGKGQMLLSPSSAWARPSLAAHSQLLSPFSDWEEVVEGPGQSLAVEFQKWKFAVQSPEVLCLGPGGH